MTRFGIFLMWLLHFLPLPVLARLGQLLGRALMWALPARRRVARRNLALCFPDMPAAAREVLLKRHFMAMGRSILERGIVWWSSAARIRRLVHIEGLEHWRQVADRPVIWLAPHFAGLDIGGPRLSIDWPVVSVYSRQKNKVVDALLYRGRMRFGKAVIFARQDGIRPVVKAIRGGTPFYYLPDQDYGPRDSVFVPFFGVPAATITGLSRLAKLGGAVVVPLATYQLPGGAGYVVRFFPPLADFPSGDDTADAARMNRCIEDMIRAAPEQYFWLHRRFKTRPPGAPSLY